MNSVGCAGAARIETRVASQVGTELAKRRVLLPQFGCLYVLLEACESSRQLEFEVETSRWTGCLLGFRAGLGHIAGWPV